MDENIRSLVEAGVSEHIKNMERAVEHGGYLADSAERLLSCINKLDEANESENETAIMDAEANLSDAFQGVRLCIHEFRKRGVRCGVLQEKE